MKKRAGIVAAVLIVAVLLSVVTVTTACDNAPKDYMAQIDRNVEQVKVDLPFSKGVNFSAWFEKTSADQIDMTYYTEQDFIDVKNMGVDVVRVPIRFHDMTDGTEAQTLDPDFLKKLDVIVGFAEKHGLYLILDNHSWSPVIGTSDDVGEILIPVWRQIAERYKGRDDHLIYELQNEPHEIDQTLWSSIQADVIEEIKSIDSDCRILVTGTDFSSINGMRALPKYDYGNIIYSFHFYDPYLFTHQGQSWAEPNMLDLKNVPFPADAHEMPELPDSLKDTWLKGQYDDYKKVATVSALEDSLDRAVEFANENNVPVFCGEFGVYTRNSMHEDRVRWYQIVSELLRVRNITYTCWDYYGGFGLYGGGRGDAEYDLDTDIAEALGFNPPEQKQREPVTSAFDIYNNGPVKKYAGISAVNCAIDYYGEGVPYALKWTDVARYGSINISFRQEIDFMSLRDGGYCITMIVKTDRDTNFNIRLLDGEKNGKIPWRMESEVKLSADDGWQTVSIRLSDMRESGAWLSETSEFLSPRGEFRWDDIVSLQFVAENEALAEHEILFSEISVTSAV